MSEKPTLNVVGAGKVASSLARCWHMAGVCEIGGVVNRSLRSTQGAVDFIGGGVVCRELDHMPPADVLMIGVTDSEIRRIAQTVAATDTLRNDSVVFHLSGALSSGELTALRDAKQAALASVHLAKSFESRVAASSQLKGIYCAIEGDDCAFEALRDWVQEVGPTVIRIASDNKLLYHAASVFSCNYFTAMFDASLRLLEEAGVSRTSATRLLSSLASGTLINLESVDTSDALTGPIARADVELVERQLAAVERFDPVLGHLYRRLGLLAVGLARRRALYDEERYVRLESVLEG